MAGLPVKYRIAKRIGEGAFGSVYEARDEFGNVYAIKIVNRETGIVAEELVL